jgi:hypothetical protein
MTDTNKKEIVTYSPQDFEREFSLDDDLPLPSKAAALALVRAGGGTEIAFRSAEEVSRAEELRRDGCDMIKAAYLFLELLECPSQARDFVIALMGISRGDTASALTIPDYVLINHTGWSKRTTINKRKAFVAWSQTANLNLIEVIEQDYESGSGKYLPMKYRVVVTDYVEQFVTLARERECWDMRSNNYSVERAIEAGLSDVADEVAKEIPTAQILRRKRFARRAGKSANKQTTLSERRRSLETKLKAAVFDWTQATLDMGYLIEVEITGLQEILQEGLDAGTQAWNQRRGALKRVNAVAGGKDG